MGSVSDKRAEQEGQEREGGEDVVRERVAALGQERLALGEHRPKEPGAAAWREYRMRARPLLCPNRASLTMWCDHGRRVGCWREPSVRFSSSRRGGEDALDDPIFFEQKRSRRCFVRIASARLKFSRFSYPIVLKAKS